MSVIPNYEAVLDLTQDSMVKDTLKPFLKLFKLPPPKCHVIQHNNSHPNDIAEQFDSRTVNKL